MATPQNKDRAVRQPRAIESAFPSENLWAVARRESWRKEIYRPIYHIHKWWATRLGSVFRALLLGALQPANTDIWDSFYSRHDFRDKVVLDPFMGSGTTIGEALKLGVRPIGCDINPISSFLVEQALSRVPARELVAQFAELERTTAPKLLRFYQTRDPDSGQPIQALYFFWVKLVKTPDGEMLPLFSSYVFAQDAYPKRKPIAKILCPACGAINTGRFDSVSLTCSACNLCFNPQEGPARGQYVTDSHGNRFRIRDLVLADQLPPQHRLYAILGARPDGGKIYLRPTEFDFDLYAEASEMLSHSDLPLPTQFVRPGHNTDQARGYRYTQWRQFFNDRQLLCLGTLLQAISAISAEGIRNQFLCLFSSALEFNNIFCSFKGEGTGAVRHMFSHHILKPERTPLENNVWGTPLNSGAFSTLFRSRLLPAKEYLDNPFELAVDTDLFDGDAASRKVVCSAPIDVHVCRTWDEFSSHPNSALVLNGDSGRLPIPDGSVDAVVTDPPYFDFVHYSELSDFFFAWLSPVLRSRYEFFDRPDSSSPSEVQDAEPDAFSNSLARVFAECRRVLKVDGVLVFTFHHSRAEGWLSVARAIRNSGMTVSATHIIHAELSVAQPKKLAKEPISLDAIIVCRPMHSEASTRLPARSLSHTKSADISRGDRFVIAAARVLEECCNPAVSDADLQRLLTDAYLAAYSKEEVATSGNTGESRAAT